MTGSFYRGTQEHLPCWFHLSATRRNVMVTGDIWRTRRSSWRRNHGDRRRGGDGYGTWQVESFGRLRFRERSELKKISPNNLLKALQVLIRFIVKTMARTECYAEFRCRCARTVKWQSDAIYGDDDGDYSQRPNMPLSCWWVETTLQRIVDLDPKRERHYFESEMLQQRQFTVRKPLTGACRTKNLFGSVKYFV